ncbi:Homeobox protein BEL1 [Zea mays]|uniref:Homeobox protein BEL1 n=2 Tax=Zea mays TaxID=4577 RepID=A0A317Y146_MAIZE|nr:hypothetical protein Zm00014a_012836 [Zea mays]PWZ52348.1 Homeobox protein BEL1 [Zea mays]
MAHDPSLGFADYFSAAAAAAAAGATAMDDDVGASELYGLHADDMEFLGMRGLAAMPPAAAHHQHHHHHGHSKAGALLDDDDAGVGPDVSGSADDATMRFLSEQQQQQQHQAPLSLSLCRPDVTTTLHEQHHLAGGGSSSRYHQEQQPAAWVQQQQHDYSPSPQQHAWHLRSSRFLVPAQQVLQEFCSLPVDSSSAAASSKRAKAANKPASQQQQEDGGGAEGSSSSASWAPSPQIQAMDALELQRLKDKLYIMLEEVDRRYRRYCEQMRALAGGFEAVAGERAAAAYTALASRTISRHFRSLRDGVVAQLQAARRALGEKDVAVPGMTRGDTPRLRVLDQCIRQHKALTQAAGMMESHPWRPQRGLPERAVTILRAWLFEHFLHPYPSDVDKHILARQTGLSRSQVSNWFINARVRLWKPMVEEMYVEEMKAEGQQDGGGQQQAGVANNPNPSSAAHAHASEAAEDDGRGDSGGAAAVVDRKPTRAQLLHDAGSLASVVNIGGGSRAGFGIMDHLDFDAYGGHHAGAVSLTLGLQQHDSHADTGGVNIAFGAPPPAHHHGYLFAPTTAAAGHQMGAGVHPGIHHHVQFSGAGAGIDGGEAAHGQEHYRGLQGGGGFHLLRDLAG